MSKSKKHTKKDVPAETLAVAEGSASAARRWEYFIEFDTLGALATGRLEELGRDGWELCAAVSTTEGPPDLSSNWPAVTKFYFKRPMPNNSDDTRGQ